MSKKRSQSPFLLDEPKLTRKEKVAQGLFGHRNTNNSPELTGNSVLEEK
jgi:hypothetical protein